MEIKHTTAGGNLFIKIDYENSGVKFQMKKENVQDMKLIGINEVFLSNKLIHTLAEEHLRHNNPDMYDSPEGCIKLPEDANVFIKEHQEEFMECADNINNIIKAYINEVDS